MRSEPLSWPSGTDGPLRAVLFDVDGTLYRLAPVRRRMGARLLAECLKNPPRGYAAVRLLSAYRKAQELLRGAAGLRPDIASAHLAAACAATGLSAEAAAPVIHQWMERAPLGMIGAWLREGTVELLRSLRQAGTRLGAVSDYPAEAKLASLGIRHWFDVVICAQDPEVQRFKPDPRGIEVALRRLGVVPRQALYVGDRPEVDGMAARRAGVRCAIVAGRDPITRAVPLRSEISQKTRQFPAADAHRTTGD